MAASYEFRIRGRLGRRLLAEFREDDLCPASERVETVLAGPVTDLAALHGLLRRFEALGIELIDVHQVADCALPQGEESATERESLPDI
jgi:hypothetical protein